VTGDPYLDGKLCSLGACLNGECGTVFPCTEQGIRDAIAHGDGPLTFSCNGATTVTTSAILRVDKDVVLDGEEKLTVDGNGNHQVFYIVRGQTAELHRMTVHNGYGPGYLGGGIENNGTLTVANCTVSGSYALHGGGIGSSGTLTVTDSTVSGNTSKDRGGGIVIWEGSATVTGVTVSDNAAGARGGGISNYTTLIVTDSTVSGNTTPDRGVGGISNLGTLVVTNSTISGNSGPGIYHWGESTEIRSSTVARNSGHALFIGNAGFFSNNSIIEGTCDPGGGGSPGGRGSIESPGDTCELNTALNMVNVSSNDLFLGPLLSNGGPTKTHALSLPSVAIDAIEEGLCIDAGGMQLATDQRGEKRPQGTKCDVGAYEAKQ
jgi:hypothetical protein